MVLSFVTNQTIQDGFDSALPSVVETLDTAEEFVNDALNVSEHGVKLVEVTCICW